jgi:hypothetical protein
MAMKPIPAKCCNVLSLTYCEITEPAATPIADVTISASDAPRKNGELTRIFVRRKQHGRQLRLITKLGDEDGDENRSENFEVHWQQLKFALVCPN